MSNDHIYSWREMILDRSEKLEEAVVCSTPPMDHINMTRVFHVGYGGTSGTPFVAFTENFVLFPIEYDGAEWVGWAPRNPVDSEGNKAEPREHQGG